jgi:hypothetical protein
MHIHMAMVLIGDELRVALHILVFKYRDRAADVKPGLAMGIAGC